MMPTLSSQVAPGVVFMATASDTSGENVGIMTTLCFQCMSIVNSSLQKDGHQIAYGVHIYTDFNDVKFVQSAQCPHTEL